MKKKGEKKKLVLAKETVQQMQNLIAVKGGASLLNYSACYPYRCWPDPVSKDC